MARDWAYEGGRLSLSLIVWLAVAVVALLGSVLLLLRGSSVEVWVADVGLPAFHQIAEDDLQLATVSASVPRGEESFSRNERDSLIGTYTLHSLDQGAVIVRSSLGPRLPTGALADSVVTLPYSGRTTVAGTLNQGDIVDLFDSGTPQAIARDLTVLDLKTGEFAAVVLAVPPSTVGAVVSVDGDDAVLVRVRPYSPP